MNQLSHWKPPAARDPDVFDVRMFGVTLLQAVRYYRSLVLAVTLGIVVLVAIYAWAWPPVYKAEARLAAERELDPPRDTFYSNWQTFRKNDGRDELGFITSGQVLNDVIDKLHLTYDDVYHPFLSHAAYLWEESWPGRTYQRMKRRFMPDPNEPPAEQMRLGRILADLREGINAAQEQDMHIATVTVKAPSRRAAEIANVLLESYLERRAQWNAEEARKAYEALTDEMNRAWQQLTEVREQRRRFNEANGLYFQFQKDTQDLKELTDVETAIANQKTKIAGLEASLRDVQAQLREEPETKVVSTIRELNSARENLKAKRVEIETALAQVRNRFRADSPEVHDLEMDLTEIEKLLTGEPPQVDRSRTDGTNALYTQLRTSYAQLQSDVAGARAALARLDERAAVLRARVTRLPALFAMSTDNDREYGLAAEKYQQIMLRRLQAEVSMATAKSGPSSVRVLDRAMPPSSKYWPRAKLLYPSAVLTGLLLGAVMAYFRALFSGRLLSVHFETGRISLPIYARIPLEAASASRFLAVTRGYGKPGEDH